MKAFTFNHERNQPTMQPVDRQGDAVMRPFGEHRQHRPAGQGHRGFVFAQARLNRLVKRLTVKKALWQVNKSLGVIANGCRGLPVTL